jgi:hypothetical protein
MNMYTQDLSREASERCSPSSFKCTTQCKRIHNGDLLLFVMPSVSIRMDNPSCGVSTTLMELVPGVNYQNVSKVLNAMKSPCNASKGSSVQDLLKILPEG